MAGLLEVDPVGEEKRISAFIRKVVGGSGAQGVAVGLSGGVDSAVTGALCVKALGKARVVAALLPSRFTPAADIQDARRLARDWGVRSYTVDITSLAESIDSAAKVSLGKVAQGNIQARVRMILLYALANSLNLLVAGTGDRSEIALGFFTKWGDGGVDLLPIAHLYKTQVRELGRHLGLPRRVVDKPASPQLWPGHTAAQELPGDYRSLDLALHSLLDRRLGEKEAASRSGLGAREVRELVAMNRRSAHKRAVPPSLMARSQEIPFMSAKD